MPYVEHTWTNGETITAAKMNNIEEGIAEAAQSGGDGGYDAVIRLVHANNSGYDTSVNLTPSIVSGSFADLYAKCNSGGYPTFLVEYSSVYGNTRFASPSMCFVTYVAPDYIAIQIVGPSPFRNFALNTSDWGVLLWLSSDVIGWD